MNNWYTQNTNLSGGIAPPELVFSWTPLFIGDSYILSPVISGVANHNMELIFTYSIDWWSNTMYVGIATTTDGGSSYTSVWEFGATTSYPPVTDTIYFTGTENMQLALYYTGDSNDADFWYVDDLYLIDLGPLPVELTSFSADVNETDVTLNWSTATETNNQGFEVQRSVNGGEFETVTFVNGNGTSTEMQHYSYTDAGLSEGIYSYRLKQVNYDGSFEYSKTIIVDIVLPDIYSLDQNYPNPFNPDTRIDFSLASDSKVTLKIYNLLGQEVTTLLNNELTAGVHYINFNASSLNSGVYFYRIEAAGVDGSSFVNVKKMILTK
jgi:hypothetical protein